MMDTDMVDYTKINFRVDLIASIPNHLNFLEECNIPDLRNENILCQALYRYEHFWLPLAAKHQPKILEAPLDIAWVWHCHMLSPAAYCSDCVRLLNGKIIDHTLERSANEKSAYLELTKALWQNEYPNDPFVVELNPTLINPKYLNKKSSLTYDVVEAAGRQKEFGYQVTLPHYRDKLFLSTSLTRYKKFLQLKIEKPKMFIVPCYDVDLLWHTHQLYPLNYKMDTENMYGKIFNHDDSVTDRSEGSKLYTADLATREAWKEVFGENFAQYGAMYRGENPMGKLLYMTPEELSLLRTRSAAIHFEKVEIKKAPRVAGKPKLKISTAVNTKKFSLLTTLKGSTTIWQGKNLINAFFDTRHVNCLLFSLQEFSGWACLGVNTVVSETTINLLPVLEKAHLGEIMTQELSTTGNYNLQIDCKLSIGPVKKGFVLLQLKAGNFERAIMPENSEQIWGPVPLPHLPPGTDNWCEVASHKVFNYCGESVFTCRLIHSQPLLQSVVHVFYKDKLAAVGHLVGTDQLPIPTQVSDKNSCITLNPKAGERAVLIKNFKGDWALIVGRWVDFKQGIPGAPGQRGVKGSPGTLHLKMWQKKTGHVQEVKLSYNLKIYSFRVSGAFVDLKQGTIQINETCDDVAEILALAFSISLLHVLCQPRPSNWTPGQTLIPNTSSKRRGVTVDYVPSESLTFVMAAGLLMSTPSNYYISQTYGRDVCAGCGGGGDTIVNDFSNVDCGVVDAGGGDTGAGCGGCGGCGGGGDGGGACGGGGGDGGGCGGGGGGCGGGGCGGGCGGCGG